MPHERAVTALGPDSAGSAGSVGSLGERAALARIIPRLPRAAAALLGPGDDAAVLAAPDGRVVLTTDVMVDGPDFRRAWSSPADLGWKAAATNLADVAAMGARPTGLLVAQKVVSGAVQALQKRRPRVSQITFDSDTRNFRQDSVDHGVLQGRGRALPNAGAPSTFFGFECEIDPNDGQVLRTRISG